MKNISRNCLAYEKFKLLVVMFHEETTQFYPLHNVIERIY